MSDKDTIYRQDAIDALNACCVKYDISPNYDDKRTDKEKFYDWWDMHKVLSMRTINDLPSAEPEIIRCKDCKWHRGQYQCLNTDTYGYGLDDFCSLAERDDLDE